MHSNLIVARMDSSSGADVAQLFEAFDKTEMPHLHGNAAPSAVPLQRPVLPPPGLRLGQRRKAHRGGEDRPALRTDKRGPQALHRAPTTRRPGGRRRTRMAKRFYSWEVRGDRPAGGHHRHRGGGAGRHRRQELLESADRGPYRDQAGSASSTRPRSAPGSPPRSTSTRAARPEPAGDPPDGPGGAVRRRHRPGGGGGQRPGRRATSTPTAPASPSAARWAPPWAWTRSTASSATAAGWTSSTTSTPCRTCTTTSCPAPSRPRWPGRRAPRARRPWSPPAAPRGSTRSATRPS